MFWNSLVILLSASEPAPFCMIEQAWQTHLDEWAWRWGEECALSGLPHPVKGRTMQRRVILRSSCAFGRVGSPPSRTKLVWVTTQGKSTEESSIYVTSLVFCSASCTGTVEDGQRAMSVLSCHQLVVRWMDWLDGVCWTFCFTKMDAVLVYKYMTKDGGIFACSLLHLECFLHRYTTTSVTGYQRQHQAIGPTSKRRGANPYHSNWHFILENKHRNVHRESRKRYAIVYLDFIYTHKIILLDLDI